MHLPRRLARSLAPSHCSRPCLSWGPREGQKPGVCGGRAALGGRGERRGRDGTRRMWLGPPRPRACGRESCDLSRAPFPRRRGSSCGAAAGAPERAPGSVPGDPGLSLCRLRTPRGYGEGLRSVLGRKQPLVICLPKVRRCCPQASNLQDSSLSGFKCTFVPSQCRKER